MRWLGGYRLRASIRANPAEKENYVSKNQTALPRLVAAASCAVFIVLAASMTSSANPVDPEVHSGVSTYRSEFNGQMIPLDASLPWRDRFTPEGAFDERFTLAGIENQRVASASSTEPAAATGDTSTLDARGTVRDIRPDAGKLKIEHGPIDRHGMPAMTMMFNLADPAMANGLSKGDEIEFNVDMGASGFTITQIRSAGDSR